MKTKESEKIISTIISWQLVLQGVIEREEVKSEIDIKKYSLLELLKANQLVEANNKRKRKLQEYWRTKNGNSNGISQHMTCADRLISAVYTLLHHAPNSELIAIVGDKGVGCVTVKY